MGALLAFTLAGVRPMVMMALLPPLAGAALPWSARLAVVGAMAVFRSFGPHAEALAPDSLAGEVLAGVLAGLALAVAFAAASMAGEVAASIIGLGFASFATAAGNVSVLGQFYGAVMALAWASTDGHLRLLELMSGGISGMEAVTLGQLSAYGGVMFGGALRMALPIVGLLLVGNLLVALAVRAAPQLGALAVGPPLLLMLLVWALPLLLEGLVDRARVTLETAAVLVR
ncbi:flagellar biosynthetic protein FliR [Polymorphobacter multimanifer]|uniref:Flagellar biosynthetic protein FliR n=2 Tax=Polymorphobacter multimanifer TaxID=1070431 RepID=A0A841L5U0_9SPHN|nr:flagellar biosynthetic protein FliR [Polymorphobacter multimanifer]MBB6226333.1 flagellar biosynthetic protein FliR [Polymorphobacter multimanifer]